MHRILNIASNEENNFDLIEQPKADIIFLTSVKADIKLLYDLIEDDIGSIKNDIRSIKNNIRALHLSFLKHPSQIDHYILNTISKAKVVVQIKLLLKYLKQVYVFLDFLLVFLHAI